jgi:hypothetical protein
MTRGDPLRVQTHDNHELHLLIFLWELDLLYPRITLTLPLDGCCMREFIAAQPQSSR